MVQVGSEGPEVVQRTLPFGDLIHLPDQRFLLSVRSTFFVAISIRMYLSFHLPSTWYLGVPFASLMTPLTLYWFLSFLLTGTLPSLGKEGDGGGLAGHPVPVVHLAVVVAVLA